MSDVIVNARLEQERCRRRCDPANPQPWCYLHEGPYLVACPLCGAPPLTGCTGPAGWPRPPHAKRVAADEVMQWCGCPQGLHLGSCQERERSL